MQNPSRMLAAIVRTATPPAVMTPALKDVVGALDKDLPVYAVRTMDTVLDASIAQQRMSMVVFAVFAGVALVLASIGLYGVVAHGVTERTHEIGVRMALGARRVDVLTLVVRQGMALVLAGIALGLLGAFALTRVMSTLLFGVTAKDPLTFMGVAALLTLVAFVACYVPARRATKVDPLIALRYE
jgi:putative ABC transport system permease protein